MKTEHVIHGSIVDSWLERRGSRRDESHIVLQVAARGRPSDLWIIEASPSLLPDSGWLQDLRENMCHGSPVAVSGQLTDGGHLSATRLQLER